jgi:hypothetical protein
VTGRQALAVPPGDHPAQSSADGTRADLARGATFQVLEGPWRGGRPQCSTGHPRASWAPCSRTGPCPQTRRARGGPQSALAPAQGLLGDGRGAAGWVKVNDQHGGRGSPRDVPHEPTENHQQGSRGVRRHARAARSARRVKGCQRSSCIGRYRGPCRTREHRPGAEGVRLPVLCAERCCCAPRAPGPCRRPPTFCFPRARPLSVGDGGDSPSPPAARWRSTAAAAAPSRTRRQAWHHAHCIALPSAARLTDPCLTSSAGDRTPCLHLAVAPPLGRASIRIS